MNPVDVQDPLPEASWLWRRVFTFVLSLISLWFVWIGMEALIAVKEPNLIYSLARYMIGVHVILITYYMVAPSAEQITKLIQAARIIREGIPSSGSATTQTSEGRTDVTTSSGSPAAPAAGPVPDEEDAAPRGAS